MIVCTFAAMSQTWVLKVFASTNTVLGNPLARNPLNPDILYGSPGNNNVYISRNKGVTWQTYGNTLPVFGTSANVIKFIAVNPLDTNQLLVGLECSGAVPDRILKSTNRGVTWSERWSGTFSYYGKPVEFKPFHPDTVYTMGNDTLYRSTDFGSTWDTMMVGRDAVHFTAWCDAELRPDSANIMFLGDAASGIWKTYDYGAHWKRVYTSAGFGEIPSIAIDPFDPRVCYASRFGGGGGLLKSTDWGESWQSIPTPIGSSSSWWVTCSPVHPGFVYFGVYSVTPGGIFVSRDSGATWGNFIDGLSAPAKFNYGLLVEDSLTVIALQATGIHRLEYPKSLHVNYPNGGESFVTGIHHTISWTVSNLYYVRLQYSLNNGATWVTLADSIPRSQTTYDWIIPAVTSTQCRIRVIDPLFTTTADSSDTTFSITPFALFAPNGGETWTGGSLQTINWTASDFPYVALYYSADSGATWTFIASRPSGSGVYSWLVPEISSDKMKIRVVDSGDTTIFVESGSVFTVQTFNQFTGVLRLQDHALLTDSISFGSAAGATDGIDSAFGELELGPKPPGGTLDIRWNILSTNGTRKDVRDTVGTAHRENLYAAEFQPGAGGYPVTLLWNPDSLVAGYYILRDRLSNGERIGVDMRRASSVNIPDTSIGAVIIKECKLTIVNYPVGSGWNMISIPVDVADRRKASLYPGAGSNAFVYTGIYVARDSLFHGQGFWIKGPLSPVSGCYLATDTQDVKAGWNMIGSISSPVLTSSIVTIPAGIIRSQFYAYTGAYHATTVIDPGQASWVKSISAGKLILNGSPFATPMSAVADRTPEGLNSLVIGDEEGRSVPLYFGADLPEDFHGSGEVPPLPPEGGFDARFGSDKGVQIHPKVFENELEYPIYVFFTGEKIFFSWVIENDKNFTYILSEKISGKDVTETRLISHGKLLFKRDDRSTFTLKVHHSSGSTEVPPTYVLGEVYPNPFNPTVHFDFSLPSSAYVNIRIFSTLGEEVASVVDGVQSAGHHQAQWNGVAANGAVAASGVYFVRMTASSLLTDHRGDQQEFSGMRKILFLR